MYRILALCMCLLLLSAAIALAGQSGTDEPAPRSAGEGDQVVKAVSTGHEKQGAEDMGEDGQAVGTQEAGGDRKPEAREMSGMSIVGNDEAPKSLYIVPWKSSEIGVETSLDTMLNEGDVPVDREVFRRQIEFYKVSTGE